MTVSVGQIGTYSQISGAGSSSFSTVATASPTTSGSGFIVAVSFDGNFTVNSVGDTFSNTYTQLTRIYDAGTNFGLERWYVANGTGGASHQANIVMSGTTTVFAALIEEKGAATSGMFGATNSTAYQYSTASPYTTSLLVTPPGSGALLISCFETGITTGSPGSPTLTESSGFTIIGQTNLAPGGYVPAIGYRVITSTGTYTPSWTAATPAGVDAIVSIDSFLGPVPAIFDGTSTSSTTVATGTGGAAMPAITAGQLLDVLICAQTTIALTDSTPTDNTSGKITWAHSHTFDDHANGFIFDRWYGVVTANFATPAVTSTWAGGTPTKLSIAVGVQNGVTVGAPWSPNSYAQSSQTGISAANSQTSGPLAGAPAAPTILAGWGFNTAATGAPTAGTSPIVFTSIGTAWAGLGSACLTYESATVVAGSDPAVTFTPFSTSKVYTFAQAYNLPAVVSGPLPRCIYVMP